MDTPDITENDPEIPDEPPPPDGAGTEVPDQPMGPPAGADAEDAPLPGIPEGEEPPAAG